METENFEALQKLLALKKLEQPPPGYFEQFSSEVMARLRAGEQHRTDWWQELSEKASWLQRLLGIFDSKPALAGAFGMLVCGVVLAGVYYSQKFEETFMEGAPALAGNLKLPDSKNLLPLNHPVNQLADSTSTNPVLNVSPVVISGGSLFDQIGVRGEVKPVSLQFGEN